MTRPRPSSSVAWPRRTLLLLLLALGRPVPGDEPIRNSTRECAICHIRWVEAFDRTGSKGAMQDILDRQAGSGDMCLSCHDGSTVDSRFTVWSTRHHTTDSVPSSAVRIPTDKFPLDPQGRMTCATCHTAHAVPDSSDLRTVIFLRQPNVDSSLCLSCHPEHAQKNDFQHPLGHSDSPVPAVILKAGGKTSADGHTIICQTCHEPHGATNAWMLVLPPSELCIACHTQKAPEAVPGSGAPVHRIGQAYPGFTPPAALLREKAAFGPDAELTCLSCHRLHEASGARPLLIRNNEDSSLCLMCHLKEQAILGSAHDLRLSSPDTVNAAGENAATSGPCGACHRIHGWAREVPETNRPHSSGCMECHQTGGPGSRNRPYVDAHPIGIAVPEDKSISLPLDAATRSIGCLTCHDPHLPRAPEAAAEEERSALSAITPGGANPPFDATDPERARSSVHAPRSFLRQEGSQLCVLCHDAMAETLRGPHDPAGFTPEVRESLGLHASIGACRACHTTHNAQGPHLWARAPVTPSGGPVADLCDTCHGGDLIGKPQETYHPLSGAATSLEPAVTVNLAPSGQSDAKDEVGCVTCHDAHGGASPAALLRRPPDDLCAECHEDKQAIRNSVHDPQVSEWSKELGFTAKGTCIGCHTIHGPRQRGIWQLLAGDDVPGQSCEACHRVGAPGPVVVAPHVGKSRDKASEEFPQSQSATRDGRIGCATCHDIHQKTPDSMLLRAARRDASLCLACHVEAGALLDTAHDMRQSAPDVRNVRGETAAESGPCGVCHLMHPASEGSDGWAQDAGPPANLRGRQCLCCHREEGCAAERTPRYADHPEVALVNRTPPGHPEYMPTFDEHGTPSDRGAISCPTCHALHATSRALGTKSGSPPSRTMSLRPVERRTLCIDCHGVEALWRFLYYHRANRNPRPGHPTEPLTSPR